MNEELLVFIEKQILGRIRNGLGPINLLNLADAAEAEGSIIQNANVVVRLDSWNLTHESNSLTVAHELNYLISIILTNLQTHFEALKLVVKTYNALFKWSPKMLQGRLGRISVLRPLELQNIRFKGVTEARQYVYDLEAKIVIRQTSGVAFRDYCVDIGQCNHISWPIGENLPCSIEKEELGTLPDGSIVLLKDYPEARPGIPYPEIVISLEEK